MLHALSLRPYKTDIYLKQPKILELKHATSFQNLKAYCMIPFTTIQLFLSSLSEPWPKSYWESQLKNSLRCIPNNRSFWICFSAFVSCSIRLSISAAWFWRISNHLDKWHPISFKYKSKERWWWIKQCHDKHHKYRILYIPTWSPVHSLQHLLPDSGDFCCRVDPWLCCNRKHRRCDGQAPADVKEMFIPFSVACWWCTVLTKSETENLFIIGPKI